MSENDGHGTEPKPLDRVDSGKPGREREQPEGAAKCGPAGRRCGLSQLRGVRAGEPEKAEQQQRCRRGNHSVRAPFLRQKGAKRKEQRRHEKHAAP